VSSASLLLALTALLASPAWGKEKTFSMMVGYPAYSGDVKVFLGPTSCKVVCRHEDREKEYNFAVTPQEFETFLNAVSDNRYSQALASWDLNTMPYPPILNTVQDPYLWINLTGDDRAVSVWTHPDINPAVRVVVDWLLKQSIVGNCMAKVPIAEQEVFPQYNLRWFWRVRDGSSHTALPVVTRRRLHGVASTLVSIVQ